MAILDCVYGGNHKQSVTRIYHHDETRKARCTPTKLLILNIVCKPLHSLETVILK